MNQHPAFVDEVEEIEHLWIAMPDSVRLAARLWLPRSAHAAPVPTLFEYIPYRKTDMVRARDERNHPFFAENGYACLRVDMRGSGDSEGVMPDMYADEELADARQIIDWVVGQSWSNGRVGMFGTSWGGTASLQASIDAHPALKTVVAVCATHDRYEDDIHHKGGLLLTDSVEWGATLPAIVGSPPTKVTGADWFERWKARLEALTFPLEAWIREEARGAYWRRGSVVHQRDRISCPVLAVGGWSDRYSNSVMSLVEARPDIVWGVVGPWGHHYPDQGHPGPAIGFQALALEWFDHWLKPETPDAAPWPRLRVWLCEFDPPVDAIDMRNGRWIETDRPSDVSRPETLYFSPQGLSPDGGASGSFDVPVDLSVGEMSGDTGYFGRYGGLPLDQHPDDARSLTFDGEPLEEDFVLYGRAEIALTVRLSDARAQLAVRLNEVTPDGQSVRVALSLVNLALDADMDGPIGVQPGELQSVTVHFHTKAYRFASGNRIRVAISSSYWPMAWPSPFPALVEILEGSITLPRHKGAPSGLSVPLPDTRDLPKVLSFEVMKAPPLERFQVQNEVGQIISGWRQPYGAIRYNAIQTTFGFETTAEHAVDRSDRLTANSSFTHRMRFERPDGTAEIRCSASLVADASMFRLCGNLEADWNGEPVVRRSWNSNVPRRLG